MINREYFDVPFAGHTLRGDSSYGSNGHILMIHGGSKDREVFAHYRQLLDEMGYGTTAFDCLGHGASTGSMSESSLDSRTRQALAVIAHLNVPLTGCLGASMGAYNAIQLSARVDLHSLILLVPGVYTPVAATVNFGPAFSQIIRQEKSWQDSDAWPLLAGFRGKILIVAAERDEVIPQEIPAKLHNAAREALWKTLFIVPNAGHNSVWKNITQSAALTEKAHAFFRTCLAPVDKA
ncbi:alpha/beta hydrolase [Phytobacter diazotrophicus]|uniref:alpha/beta fold hydrolase n=1 Tax=Phytobacter diazotrophicus TaxID=395631 RepID=UPI002FF8B6B7